MTKHAKTDENYRIKQLNCSDINTNERLNYKILYFIIDDLSRDFNKFLDIGSQEGQFADTLNKNVKIKNTTCLDINDVTVANGKKKHPDFKWVCGDIITSNVKGKYDLITILNCLFYFYNNEFLNKLHDMTRSGGNVVISYGDLNFTKKKIADDDITKSFEKAGFKLRSIAKILEKCSFDEKTHVTGNRWYTCISFQKPD